MSISLIWRLGLQSNDPDAIIIVVGICDSFCSTSATMGTQSHSQQKKRSKYRARHDGATKAVHLAVSFAMQSQP